MNHCLTNHAHQLPMVTGALLDNFLDPAAQQLAVLLGQILGRQHDDRNILPFNPKQLRETTIHPDTRRLVQLTVAEADGSGELLDMLLAKRRSGDRRGWLQEKGNLAEV